MKASLGSHTESQVLPLSVSALSLLGNPKKRRCHRGSGIVVLSYCEAFKEIRSWWYLGMYIDRQLSTDFNIVYDSMLKDGLKFLSQKSNDCAGLSRLGSVTS